uniref:Uncharacterized protein n=1 Tax=Aegilops tauschii subsp. strangulata TaxID=200361 RepID=A0A453SUY2_AEGTS
HEQSSSSWAWRCSAPSIPFPAQIGATLAGGILLHHRPNSSSTSTLAPSLHPGPRPTTEWLAGDSWCRRREGGIAGDRRGEARGGSRFGKGRCRLAGAVGARAAELGEATARGHC